MKLESMVVAKSVLDSSCWEHQVLTFTLATREHPLEAWAPATSVLPIAITFEWRRYGRVAEKIQQYSTGMTFEWLTSCKLP